jgi:hypothetical protein
MTTVTLPSEFGPITLDVGALQAPRHPDHKPERHFRAYLGEGKVNGKPWGRIEYSFKTDGWNGPDGKPRLVYSDLVAYTDATNYQRTILTQKGHSRVRNAIEDAVQAFLASPAFPAVTEQAQADQRERVKTSAADKVERLQKRILEIQALAASADTHPNPEELERELDQLWRDRV